MLFRSLRLSFSVLFAAQPWQLRCLSPLLCRSILHLLPFYGMKKALFPVLSCCFFNLTVYIISAFSVQKKEIKRHFGQSGEISGNTGKFFYFILLQSKTAYAIISSGNKRIIECVMLRTKRTNPRKVVAYFRGFFLFSVR